VKRNLGYAGKMASVRLYAASGTMLFWRSTKKRRFEVEIQELKNINGKRSVEVEVSKNTELFSRS